MGLKKDGYCPQCGTSVSERDNFCAPKNKKATERLRQLMNNNFKDDEVEIRINYDR